MWACPPHYTAFSILDSLSFCDSQKVPTQFPMPLDGRKQLPLRTTKTFIFTGRKAGLTGSSESPESQNEFESQKRNESTTSSRWVLLSSLPGLRNWSSEWLRGCLRSQSSWMARPVFSPRPCVHAHLSHCLVWCSQVAHFQLESKDPACLTVSAGQFLQPQLTNNRGMDNPSISEYSKMF